MKSGWQTVKLTDVAEISGRIGWKGLTAKEYTQEGPLFLSVHSLNYGDFVDFRDAFHISQARYDESPEIMLQSDDILICKDGAGIGKVGIVGELSEQTTINSSLLLIRSKPKIAPKYLYYALMSPYFQAIVQSRLEGATTPHLYQRDIAGFPIYLPPLTEQRRIVVALDSAFLGIATATANARKNLSNACSLFEGYLQSILTEGGDKWAEYTFGQICSISSKLVDPRLPAYLDLPHIGAGNMESRTGGIVDVLTAREEGLKSGKFLFDPSMVLYSKIRPYLMKACRPDFSGLCSADVYPLLPKAGLLNRDMLFHILMSDKFTAYAEAGSARAGMPKVNRDHLFRYPVRLPDVATQTAICIKLDGLSVKCQELTDVFKTKLSAFAELRQSLLQKAFAGELTVASARQIDPAANDNFANPQGTAQILAFAYWLHKKHNRDLSYKHVKAQKCLQLVESVGRIELGRQPIKDAAGPNDFPHMLRAEEWAEEQGFFKFVPSTNGPGYDFKKLANYDALWTDAVSSTKPIAAALEKAIMPLVPMDKEGAELFATVHAAWNNLIHDSATITDDAIIKEARDDWHADKFNIPEHKFREAVKLIRAKNMEPDGSAKYVGGQVRLI